MMRRAMLGFICLLPIAGQCVGACSPSNSEGGSGGSAQSGAAGQGVSGASSGGASSGGASANAGGSSTTAGQSAAGGGTVAGHSGSGGSGAGGKSSGAGGKTSAAGGKTSGAGGRDCEAVQCLRAYECVEKCGGPVVTSGCCPCGGGTIDRVIECSTNGGAGGEGGASNVDLSKLNSACVNGACPSGLTPIKFYGIAGMSGPQFCWCSIPCTAASTICPAGTECQNVADGPGLICYAN